MIGSARGWKSSEPNATRVAYRDFAGDVYNCPCVMVSPPVPTAPSPAIAEFTRKAVVAGVVLGLVFGAANAYLGLRVGLTVSASIPAAVMTVALFRLLRLRGHDPRGEPLADDRLGLDLARDRARSSRSRRSSSGAWRRRTCRSSRSASSAACSASPR